MTKRLMKYNPAFLSDEDLIRSFVARKTDLDLLLRVIQDNTSGANQHVLVIGPRGSGKTTLLLRIAGEVRKDPTLSQKWYPLSFSEESYEVSTIGEFWLESLFHLGRQTKDATWKKTHEELKKERDDKILRDRALSQLMDFADKEGKRILLIVENLNMLFEDQITEKEAWNLRHTLLNEPRIMLLASAVSRFEEMDSAGKAMYELFKPHELKPLDEVECRAVWVNITGSAPKDDRIRPLQILTGGNPRLLSIISAFGAKLSFRDLMEDLMHLVDDHTEYFKSHLDQLAPVERKVYLSLAELWKPSTAKDVATAARLDVSKTSALLNRLVGRGAVTVLEEEKRTKWYQTSERMYNIYHLMRRRGAPSSRVQGLVHFMIDFYGEEELLKMTRLLAEEAVGLETELCNDHYLAYESIITNVRSNKLRDQIIDATPKAFFEAEIAPPSIKKLGEVKSKQGQIYPKDAYYQIWASDEIRNSASKILNRIVSLSPIQKPVVIDEVIADINELIIKDPNNSFLWSILGKFNADYASRYDEAETCLKRATDINNNNYYAWGALGVLLQENLSRFDEAEKVYRKALAIQPNYDWAWAQLGQLLHDKLNRYEEAEQAYKKAIELKPEYDWAWAQLGQLLHDKLNRYEEAEQAYKKAIELKPEYDWAWAQLGKMLHEKLNRYEEAEQAYKKAIELKPEYVWAWTQLGQLLHDKLNRHEEAEQAYKKAIGLRPDFALGWARFGQLLHEKQNRYTEAEQAYKKAIELKPEYAWVWAQLGQLLHDKLNRYEEAEQAYKKAIEIDTAYVWAWIKLGDLLYEKVRHYDEAEVAYTTATKLVPDDIIYPIYKLINMLLHGLNDPSRAFDIARQTIVDKPKNFTLLNTLAWAFYKYGNSSYFEYAEAWARKALSLSEDYAEAHHTLACILCAMNKNAEALKHAQIYFENKDKIEHNDDAIELIISLAVADSAKEALKMLEKSPAFKSLEPLVVGLRLYLGEDVKAAVEVLEVGKDVVKRIQLRRKM